MRINVQMPGGTVNPFHPGLMWRRGAYLLRCARRAIMSPGVHRVERFGGVFYRYRGKLYPAYLNEGNAVSWIREAALRECVGYGLDIGASVWPLPGAVAVENEPGRNAYALDEIADGSLDYVFSSHCLEHLDRWPQALALWVRKLRSGGVLFLYLPHPSMKLWHRGSPWVGSQHRWVPTPARLRRFLPTLGLSVERCTKHPDVYWSFHVVGRKTEPRVSLRMGEEASPRSMNRPS